MKRLSKYGAVPTASALRNRKYREKKRVGEGRERLSASPHWTLEERLAFRSQRIGDCLIWTGSTIEGYPWMRWDGTGCRVTRLVLMNRLGRDLLPGMLACHTCDTPACIEEAHLFEGTPKDNRSDMDAKDRARPARGERVHTAKLTAENVREIRAATGTLKEIGAKYGVHYGQISKIKRGKSWPHV